MSDGFIPCKESRTLNGVRVSCDKRQLPKHNVHHCPTWNVVWRHGDTPPPACFAAQGSGLRRRLRVAAEAQGSARHHPGAVVSA